MKLWVICGPKSSGNRAVAAAFVRAGCWGEGSTNQPVNARDIPQSGPAVWITHYPTQDVPLAIELGWQPELVVMVREPLAQAKSCVNRGHSATEEEALREREMVFHANVRFARLNNIPLHILPYEGLSPDFFRQWFPTIGLRGDTVDQPLPVHGQELQIDRFKPQNEKYYAT